MANPTWPSALPAPSDQNVSYAPLVDNVISTSVESGPVKYRRRFTYVPQKATFTLVLTGTQCATLNDFVATTLRDVNPFDWKDFRSGSAATYTFTRRPIFELAAPGVWTAHIELRMQ